MITQKRNGTNGQSIDHAGSNQSEPSIAVVLMEESIENVARVAVEDGAYLIHALRRENREEANALATMADSDRLEAIHRWLSFGATLDKRAAAVAEADYLGREAEHLLDEVRRYFEHEVRVRFDPANENSLTRPLVEQAQDSKRVLVAAQQQLQELMRVNFDPNDARSAVAKIAVLLNGLESQIAVRFDPKRKDSVLGRFDERVELMVKRLTAPDGPFQRVTAELQALRAEFARVEAVREAKTAVVERTTVKGGVFEDEMEARLVALARVQGDIVERTGTKAGPGGSKRGDFVIKLAGDLGCIAVEAKSGAINSLPKLIKEMEQTKATRSVDLVMAVVRDADQMPAQARPFQFYDEGIVVCADNFEFAFRIARWVVALQSQHVPNSIDAAAAHEAVAEIHAALKHLRPARQQLVVIEKAADSLREHLGTMEEDIVNSVAGLNRSLGDGA